MTRLSTLPAPEKPDADCLEGAVLPEVCEEKRQSTSSTCSTSSKASSASSLTTSSTSSDDEQPISSSRGSSKRSRKRQRRELEIQKWLTHYNFQAVDIPRPLSRFTSEQEMVYPVHVAAIVGDCTVLRHLLATGADLDQESSLGRTAYDFACETNNAGSHGDAV
ncbi:unnamed protein product [Effrenium voratum]|uniref:Uncharacterized protein n=1 Tax=Effrenium voratum TaxID=2562239 RepID=A0AA36I1F7_9DINO|nr:unnamed protein product [Effrenium voratum]